MQPTYEEEINHTIFELFKCNNTDSNIINWYNTYGSICDEIINGICRTKNTHFMNNKQKEVWSITSKDMRILLYEIIQISTSLNNIQMNHIIQNLKEIIPLREELIKEFRKARDNNDSLLLSRFATDFSDIPIHWSFASIEEKERAKKSWIALTKLSLKINKTTSFLNSNSPDYWKNITKEWIEEIK